MGVKGISQFTGTLVGAKQVFDHGTYVEALDFYHIPDITSDQISDKKRAIRLGSMARLMKAMCEQGAETTEYENVVLFSYICIDAVKHHLDYEKAYEDLGIRDLMDKYLKSN